MSEGVTTLHRFKYLQALTRSGAEELVALLRAIRIPITIEQFVSNPDGSHTAYFTSDRLIRFRERNRNGNAG